MQNHPKKWIWQHEKYPYFTYDKASLVELLTQIEYNHGVLNGIAKTINKDDMQNIELEALTNEAIHTSEIEGEYLKRGSVRASLEKKLTDNFDTDKDSSTHQTDALVKILLDCNLNKSPLSQERLHSWHSSLFVSRYSGLDKIQIASFRNHDNMEVVSGAIGREKVHYLAPPKELIEKDIKRLLNWIETSTENIYIKSALAHLWFVCIHPYDDGNGRIARAISDYILSNNKNLETGFKLYSLSTAINHDRKGYYNILDNTTNLFKNRDFDFTLWINWHLNTVNHAMLDAQKQVQYLIEKTKFWDRHRKDNLNHRQVKVLNKILDIGSENFEGGISTKKYIAITKKSKATVVRDIQELVEKGCLERVKGTSGRNIRYSIKIF
jgi:Fic family protein